MGIDIYTPDSNKIVHKTKVDFMRRIIPETIYLVQHDSLIPVVEVKLYSNGVPFLIPDNEGVEMSVRWGDGIKKDILGCNVNRSIIYFDIDSEMSNKFGLFNPILELVVTETTQKLGSSPMIFSIDENPIP